MRVHRNLGVKLTDEDYEYVDNFKRENNLKSRNSAFGKIINDHREGHQKMIKEIIEGVKAEIINAEFREEIEQLKKMIKNDLIKDLQNI